MDDVKEIRVAVAYTKNLGNYESLRLEAGLTVAVAEGKNVADVFARAWDTARDQIKGEVIKTVAAFRGGSR